jgi:hypothetical protein
LCKESVVGIWEINHFQNYVWMSVYLNSGITLLLLRLRPLILTLSCPSPAPGQAPLHWPRSLLVNKNCVWDVTIISSSVVLFYLW